MLLQKIQTTRNEFRSELASAKDSSNLENLRIKYLSRNGLLSALFDEIKNVSQADRPAVGKELNLLRNEMNTLFNDVKDQLSQKQKNQGEVTDVTLPGDPINYGSVHLLTKTLEDIKSVFKGLGFSVFEGPELESDYYNFEALNFPRDHPARDMQDTFFISDDFLLRTHTSPVQIRVMEKMEPPVRAIMPGRVYRNEAVSARSYCMFHQVEGLYVDTDVTFAELKGTLVSFAEQFYGEGLKYRFRASFFPFTEPSAEMDVSCYICGGSGCRVCKYSGWIEILGCGMVDPNVLKYVGYDPEKYTGYAFGMGIERTTMIKYGIPDIRIFFENDIRFLKQF